MSMKEVCGCCKKTTARSTEEQKKLIHRLNRIEGQICGIRKMVENNAYCTDILRDIREGKDEVIDELVATLQKLMK